MTSSLAKDKKWANEPELKQSLEELRSENDHLNRQLAMLSMKLSQKNGLLKGLKSEMGRLVKLEDDAQLRLDLDRLRRRIHFDENLEENWSQFALYFDQAHQDFIKRLAGSHPNLPYRDQQLCAYLRLNMSTKEIAPLLNISVRGVEISRYRLRKKLEMPKQQHLVEFLKNI